jgi:hypothetical protein
MLRADQRGIRTRAVSTVFPSVFVVKTLDADSDLFRNQQSPDPDPMIPVPEHCNKDCTLPRRLAGCTAGIFVISNNERSSSSFVHGVA